MRDKEYKVWKKLTLLNGVKDNLKVSILSPPAIAISWSVIEVDGVQFLYFLESSSLDLTPWAVNLLRLANSVSIEDVHHLLGIE